MGQGVRLTRRGLGSLIPPAPGPEHPQHHRLPAWAGRESLFITALPLEQTFGCPYTHPIEKRNIKAFISILLNRVGECL